MFGNAEVNRRVKVNCVWSINSSKIVVILKINYEYEIEF